MRLRRGGRSKADRDATAAVGVTSSVPPDTIGSQPSETAIVGSVLGLQAPPHRADRAAIDEWGLYDPEVCGYRALLASLGTAENREAEPLDEDPAELLLRQQAQSLGLPAEVLEPEPAEDRAGQQLSPAASAVASCRVARFAPLALWARVSDDGSLPPVSAAFSPVSRAVARWLSDRVPYCEERASDDLGALLGRLTLPAFTAATLRASGCRIHQIRIPPAPEVPDADPMPGAEDAFEAPAPADVVRDEQPRRSPAIRPLVPTRNRVAMALG